MKKLLFAISLSLLTLSSFAQDKNKYAKHITKTTVSTQDRWMTPEKSKGMIKSMEPLSIVKWRNKGEEPTMAVYLNVQGLTYIREKIFGGKITFTDGDVLEFPDKRVSVKNIDTSNRDSGWMYSIASELSSEDLDKLINKDIEEVSVYIFKYPISKKKRKKIKGWSLAIKEAI
jgi:hypothetical protein